MREKIYVCSPYRGDIAKNTWYASAYARFVLEMGYLPVAPHIYFPRFMFDERASDRELAMEMNHQLLAECRALWCFGDEVTDGMSKELEWAAELGIRVRKFADNFEEVG